jgi:hypothetical protein
MEWISRVRGWFRLVLDAHAKYTHVWVEDVPDHAENGCIYLVGDQPKPWAAVFICPCGCGELISLSLIEHDDPRWRHHVDIWGAISLSPSVWRTRGCESHFFIRKGRVLWALPNR